MLKLSESSAILILALACCRQVTLQLHGLLLELHQLALDLHLLRAQLRNLLIQIAQESLELPTLGRLDLRVLFLERSDPLVLSLIGFLHLLHDVLAHLGFLFHLRDK